MEPGLTDRAPGAGTRPSPAPFGELIMRKTLLVAACLVLATGCGTASAGHGAQGGQGAHGAHGAAAVPPPVTSFPVGDHNLADVMFLQMAIAHHRQGVDLTALVESRPVRPEVRDLALAVKATQASEIESMSAWLVEWDKPVEVDTNPDAHAHHGGLPLTDASTIADLAAAPEADFETRFLNLLTGHQHNAVEMARTQLKEGASKPVREFADRVVRSRTGQIQQLLELSN